MIFRRAIVSELSSNAGAVFTVLFTIVFSVTLVRILGEAAGGKVDNQAVFAIMALSALTSLPLLLSLTLFIAVLITLSRAYRDSEMVVWFASGQSLTAWLRPVLRFALPGVLLVAVLSTVATPWANSQITESRQRFAQRDDVSRVAPGRFIESGKAEGATCAAGGRRVGDRGFFIEPTVFTNVKDEMKIAREEIFGPVLSVLKFSDMEELIRRANATTFGLAAAVWTRDIARAHEVAKRLRAGTVWVNCYDVFDAAAPFGGFKQSGFGRELGERGLDPYLETKTVTVSLDPRGA